MNQPMAGAGLGTTLSTMDAAATHVDDVNQQITALLSRVRGTVAQLSGATWQGGAQVAFANVMANWDSESVRLNRALEGIAGQLRTNRQAFDATEQDNASAITRLGAAGPLSL